MSCVQRADDAPPIVAVPRQQRVRDLRDCLAELPDPEQYVYCMSPELVAAVMRAYVKQSAWMVQRADWAYLRQFGLADFVMPVLTGFGIAVWRILQDEARQ